MLGKREIKVDTIEQLLNQNQQLKDNWKLLEEWLKEEIKRDSGNSIDLSIRSHLLFDVLSKVQEIGGINE